MLEAKRCQQPFVAALEGSVLKVTSEYLFRRDNEQLHWQLIEQSGSIDSGTLELALQPSGSVEIAYRAINSSLEPRWLNVWINQTQATSWSDADHEVARWQFELGAKIDGMTLAAASAVSIETEADTYRVFR